jgi:hypothetical protein
MKTLKKAALNYEKIIGKDKKAITEIVYYVGYEKYLASCFEQIKFENILTVLEKNIDFLTEIVNKGFYYINALTGILMQYFQRMKIITSCFLKTARNNNSTEFCEVAEECLSLGTFISGTIGRVSFAKDISFFIYRKEDFLKKVSIFREKQREMINGFMNGGIYGKE